jgi:hypothetical protein
VEDIYYEMEVIMKKEMNYVDLKMHNLFQKKSWNGPWTTTWRTPNVLNPIICHLNFNAHISRYCQKNVGLIFICDLHGLWDIDCNKDKIKSNTLPKWFIWIGNTKKLVKTYAYVIWKHEEYPEKIK